MGQYCKSLYFCGPLIFAKQTNAKIRGHEKNTGSAMCIYRLTSILLKGILSNLSNSLKLNY